MKVFVKGKGEVTLTQANFVAQGGQASVYQRNGTAYKVYTNPSDSIPEAKFSELAPIDDPNVIKPDDLLLADKGAASVGYTMRYLSDTFALCQVFPKAFRDRNGFTQGKAQQLVEQLFARVSAVHRSDALVVDLNELNVLVSQALDEIYLIDVDSYQTRSFKAQVIMPSVRDWSVKPADFSRLSDWFSFSILAFQIYIGIHPYRGTHAAAAQLPPDQRLEYRMKSNLSALGPGVSLPKICPTVDVIPEQLRSWMRAVLQDGKRLPPPDPSGVATAVVSTPKTAFSFGAGLLVTEVDDVGADVLAHVESGGSRMDLTASGIVVTTAGRRKSHPVPSGRVLVGFTPRGNVPVALSVMGGIAVLHVVGSAKTLALSFPATELALGAGGFYVRSRDKVYEIEIHERGDTVGMVVGRIVANVLEHASRLYDGCAVQSMLGSAFVSLFPRARAGYQVRVPELDSYRVLDARFERGVLMVVGAKAGRYDRLVLRFDENYGSYDLRIVEGIAPSGLNFIVTPGGVCVCVTEDEKIEAFSATKDAAGVRVIDDEAMGSDMRLMVVNGQPGFARGGRLFTMRMK